MAKDDELRAEYATNLYLNEGGVTYSEEDMAAEIANVTYWTWEELENPPFEPGTTMRTMAQFFIDQGQIEAGQPVQHHRFPEVRDLPDRDSGLP